MEKELTLTAYEGDKPYIFVSYAHKNSDEVLPIIAAMQNAGYRVWFDQGIEAGSEWPEYIEDHLIGCKAVLVFMSEHVVESANCRNEINLAHSLKKDLLVINLEPTQLRRGLALQLGTVQSIPLYEIPDENALMDEIYAVSLLDACGENLKKPSTPRTKKVTHALVQRKKRKNTVIIAVLVALVLIVGIIAGVALSKNSTQPDPSELFDYRHTSHGIEITGIKESDPGEIVIPEKIEGVPVVSICDAAFKGYDRVTSVTLCKNLTNIGERAFENCDGLTEIVLPDSLTSIGASAFADCDGLVKIVIPDSVQTIGSLAFSGCAKLTDVTVGKGVTSIADDVFNNSSVKIASVPTIAIPCIAKTSLTSLTVNSGSEILSTDWQSCAYSLKSLKICEGITKIGEYAFFDLHEIESLSLPSTLTHIGDYAFQGCKIKSLTIPASVQMVGEGAFQDCSMLTKLIIEEGASNIAKWAFLRCTALEALTLPASVSNSFGGAQFMECTGLKSVTFGDGFESIRSSMFSGCTSLEQVSIPNTVKQIYSSAFSDCKALESIIIPDSVTTIDSYAFDGCTKLSDIQLSKNLVTIGDFAFLGCDFTSIVLPGSLKFLNQGAFHNCDTLTSIYIPSGVISVEQKVFYGCNDLTIYCGAEKPSNQWDPSWNIDNRPVVWGFKGEIPQ